MAPSKDKCLLCCLAFFGRQEFFRCSACKRRAHGKCIVLPDEELQRLISGEQPFVCNLCVAAASPARPSDPGDQTSEDGEPANIPAKRVASPVGASFNPSADLRAEVAALKNLLSEACASLSFLGDVVTELREENRLLRRDHVAGLAHQAAIVASLREEVRCLRGELARPPPSPPASPKPANPFMPPVTSPQSGIPTRSSFAEAAAGAAGEGAPFLSSTTASPFVDRPSSQPATALSTLVSPSVHPLPPPPRSDTAFNGPPTNLQKKRSPPRVGASEASQLVVVHRPPSSRAIFVSKLSANTTSAQLLAHLSTVQVTPLSCKRLRTKYDSYSSFCVTVNEECFRRLSDPSMWPKGCLFKPFQGKVHPGMLHSSEITENDQ